MAAEYDQQIWLDEMLMGLGVVRWWLCRGLTGRVLEVSCGTGRNLHHYNSDATVTATDLSEDMLEIAKAKVSPAPHAHIVALLKLPPNSRGCRLQLEAWLRP